jgi:hypothetical protein
MRSEANGQRQRAGSCRATGLPDAVVERIIIGVIMLRGQLDIADACAAILFAKWARNVGDTEWPETIDDLADVLPEPARRLRLVPTTMVSCCPSGAA